MLKKAALVFAGAAIVAGCATQGGQQNENQRATTGAIIGAVAGAVLGHQMDHDNGALAGAVVGGVAGGVIGHSMDQQQQEFNRALQDEQRQNEIKVQRVRDDLLKLTLQNSVTFDFNKSAIKPGFRPTLDKVANVLSQYKDTHITIVGHTDSVGSDAYNQKLSEQRARSVADYLVSKGVSPYRFSTLGKGESQPIASNDTEEGRAMNRRVEIFVQQQNPPTDNRYAPPPGSQSAPPADSRYSTPPAGSSSYPPPASGYRN